VVHVLLRAPVMDNLLFITCPHHIYTLIGDTSLNKLSITLTSMFSGYHGSEIFNQSPQLSHSVFPISPEPHTPELQTPPPPDSPTGRLSLLPPRMRPPESLPAPLLSPTSADLAIGVPCLRQQ
jgi:hypothetical protein